MASDIDELLESLRKDEEVCRHVAATLTKQYDTIIATRVYRTSLSQRAEQFIADADLYARRIAAIEKLREQARRLAAVCNIQREIHTGLMDDVLVSDPRNDDGS